MQISQNFTVKQKVERFGVALRGLIDFLCISRVLVLVLIATGVAILKELTPVLVSIMQQKLHTRPYCTVTKLLAQSPWHLFRTTVPQKMPAA